MKDQRSLSPIKRVSLIFLTITGLGITSSWLSSCSDTTAATGDHLNIERRLTSIEAKQNDQGKTLTEVNTTVTTMADLTTSLSSDIGDMALQIGYMADRIVETEKLIVYVITNQTNAAVDVLGTAVLPNADGSKSTTPILNIPANTIANNLVLKNILEGHNSANGVLLSANPVTPTTTTPPSLKFIGSNVNYLLLVSTVATFETGKTTQTVVNPVAPLNTAENLTSVWTANLSSLFPGAGAATGQTVYVAVKVIPGGNLSAISNSLMFSNL